MLNIYVGPMFSGKTTKLIHMFNENKNENKIIIDYNIEKENEDNIIENHDGLKLDCIKCINFASQEMNQFIDRAEFIYINEAQFFPDLFEFVSHQLSLNKFIYIYGLDGDYKQNKIGQILDLIPLCDNIYKLKGQCLLCDNKSLFSKRITSSTKQYLPGEEHYIPLCRKCYEL